MENKQEIKVTSIEGNGQWLDGGSMYGNAPKALWSRWSQPDEQGRIRLACRSMYVEVGSFKILCETGIGAYMDPKMSERFGVEKGGHVLLKNLEKSHIDPNDIDFVILSHLHFDHAGGLLPSFEEISAGNDDLLFKNAKYVVGQEAFDRALNPHFRDKASFIDGMTEKLIASKRLLVLKEGETVPELKDSLEFFTSNGHTPGQLHAVFHGRESSIVFAGDLIPGVPWVNLPITMGYDRYPELLIDEKKKLYEDLVPNEWLLFFTHDTKVSSARVKLNERKKYEAVNLIEQMVSQPI